MGRMYYAYGSNPVKLTNNTALEFDPAAERQRTTSLPSMTGCSWQT
jgi:hypothetical protein